MASVVRTTAVWCLWFYMLLASAVLLKAVFHAASYLPERVPLVVALPSGAGAEERQAVETAVSAEGGSFQFVPADQGLAELTAVLGREGTSLDSSALAEVPVNPVPDVYVVRASESLRYEKIADAVKSVLPTARIECDFSVHRKLAPALRLARVLAGLAVFVLCVLFCLSTANRLTAELWGVLRESSLAILGSIAVMGGAAAAAGFAAARHPDFWFAPYAQVLSRFFQEARLDWMFGVACLSVWIVLLLLSYGMRRRTLPSAPVLLLAVLSVFSLSPSPANASGASPGREADLKTAHEDVMRQIREREVEYEKEQDLLKETRREAVELAKRERQFLKKLDAADQALSQTRMELSILEKQLEAMKTDIQATKEKWETEHADLIHRHALRLHRLKSLYLFSLRLSPPADFLAYGDLSVPLRLRRIIATSASVDASLIREISFRKGEIEKIQELLAAKERSLLAAQEKKRALDERQSRERARRQELLEEVRGRKSSKDEQARRLDEESANLKILLTALREQSLKLKEQLAYLKKEFEDKKGLLRWPVPSSAVRSIQSFGKFYDDAIQSWRVNKGIDIMTENNQSVSAVSRGEVVFADFLGRMGNLVVLAHGGDYFTLYAHLSEIGVNLGSKIDAGEILGRAGNTGLLQDDPVLHFEVRQGSQAVDPEIWLGRR